MSGLLNGTGVVLGADLIREMGWNTCTLTEDLELSAQCGLRGEKIAYLENAVTYDEQPVGFWVSFEQRRRWFRGSMQCTLRYGPKLLWRAIRHRSLQALDLAVFFLGNIMQFVCLVPGAVAAVETVRFAAGLGGVEVVAALAVAVAIVYIAAISLGAALICHLAGKKPGREMPGVLGFWLIALTWFPANLSALIVPPRWRAIPHTSRATLADVAPPPPRQGARALRGHQLANRPPGRGNSRVPGGFWKGAFCMRKCLRCGAEMKENCDLRVQGAGYGLVLQGRKQALWRPRRQAQGRYLSRCGEISLYLDDVEKLR